MQICQSGKSLAFEHEFLEARWIFGVAMERESFACEKPKIDDNSGYMAIQSEFQKRKRDGTSFDAIAVDAVDVWLLCQYDNDKCTRRHIVGVYVCVCSRCTFNWTRDAPECKYRYISRQYVTLTGVHRMPQYKSRHIDKWVHSTHVFRDTNKLRLERPIDRCECQHTHTHTPCAVCRVRGCCNCSPFNQLTCQFILTFV